MNKIQKCNRDFFAGNYSFQRGDTFLATLSVIRLRFYRATAYNATHGIAKAFLSVCPSVKRVYCDKTKEALEACAHVDLYVRSLPVIFGQN